MKKIITTIKTNFPYMMGVMVLVCGLGTYYSISFAGKMEKTYAPMLKASVDWPGTDGKIIKHLIYEKKTGRFSHSPRTHYFAEPTYEYVVNGKRLNNHRICFYHSNCNSGTTRKDAESLLQQYPLNSAVTVYYNPDNPAISTLRRGDNESIKQINDEIKDSRIYTVILSLLTILSLFLTVKTAKEFKE